MKKQNNKKIFFIIVAVFTVALAISICLYLTYRHYKKKTIPSSQEVSQQSTATNTENSNKSNQDSSTQPDTAPTPAAQPSAPAKPPQVPSFTKSSGNNGPIPANVLVDFVCNSEPGTTCQIILNSGNKQIVLAEQQVKDNGRGQWFTNWNWTSVSSKWSVLARAKNAKGGIADSNKQTLEVK